MNMLGKRETNTVLDFNRELAKQVEEVVERGQLCLTLGGDHSGRQVEEVVERGQLCLTLGEDHSGRQVEEVVERG